MPEQAIFLFALADFIVYPPKPFSSNYTVPLYSSLFLLYRFSHSGFSIYPMDFTRCKGLSLGFKARFKMYFFWILPPTESNRQEKPASKARLMTVDLHC